MAEEFFLATEKSVDIHNKVVETEPKLFFKMVRKQRDGAPDYEFEGKATKEHVQQYAAAYGKFKKLNPSFELPWGEDKDFVGVKAQEVGEVRFERLPAEKQPKTDEEKEELEESEKGSTLTADGKHSIPKTKAKGK